MNNVSTIVHLKSIVLSVFSLIRSPESLPGNLLETFGEWRRNRQWILIFSTLPALVVLFGFLCSGFTAFFRSPSNISQQILIKVDKKIPVDTLTLLAFEEHYIRNSVKKRSEAIVIANPVSDDRPSFARNELVANDELAHSAKFRECNLLLNRACKVSEASVKARFRLGLLTSLDTKLPDPQGSADKIMSKLAESKAEPFAEAHAWMAVTLYGLAGKRTLEKSEKNQLEDSFKFASKWRLIDPVLLSIYSAICFKEKKVDKALAMAKQAAETRPELYLEYAQICKLIGPEQEQEMSRAAKAAGEAFNAKLGTSSEKDEDRLGYAQSLIMQGENEKAIEILQLGLNDDPTGHLLIRRGLAELFVGKFRSDNEAIFNLSLNGAKRSVRVISEQVGDTPTAKPEMPTEINWTNLQKAAEYDPNNPLVGQEIATQWRRHTKPPPDLHKTIFLQLQNDLASTGARLMIAELCLVSGREKDARDQWEMVLQKEPNVLPALNNLAILLSRDTPPQLVRAIELIDRAYRIQPLDAEMCDSYGEVMMNAGRPIEAIAKLEEAIRIDPRRKDTRKRLAMCYRQLGMNEMADEQHVQINRLEAIENKNADSTLNEFK